MPRNLEVPILSREYAYAEVFSRLSKKPKSLRNCPKPFKRWSAAWDNLPHEPSNPRRLLQSDLSIAGAFVSGLSLPVPPSPLEALAWVPSHRLLEPLGLS